MKLSCRERQCFRVGEGVVPEGKVKKKKSKKWAQELRVTGGAESGQLSGCLKAQRQAQRPLFWRRGRLCVFPDLQLSVCAFRFKLLLVRIPQRPRPQSHG